MTVPIVVPLVGLPGVGKTTLASFVTKHCRDSTATAVFPTPVTFHLQFDAFLPRIVSGSDKLTKLFRKAAVLIVDCILETLTSSEIHPLTVDAILSDLQRQIDALAPSSETVDAAEKVISTLVVGSNSESQLCASTPVIIILDDNNIYRSMRYEYYQLSRKHSVSFLQLVFESSVTEAKTNDRARDVTRCVGDDVIDKMAMRLETPDSIGYRWERRSCRLRCDEGFTYVALDGIEGKPETEVNSSSSQNLLQVIERIIIEGQNPVQPTVIDASASEEQREIDRQVSLKNAHHQCDVKLRSLVGQRMREVKLSGGDAKSEASKLAIVKASIFDKAKRGEIALDLDGLNSEVESLFLAELVSATE